MNYWWVQLAAVLLLLAFYAVGARKNRSVRSILWTCGYVIGFHVMTLPA